jgi:GntR family transcriptional regulator, L-lactate dehydrogenase operon regulator
MGMRAHRGSPPRGRASDDNLAFVAQTIRTIDKERARRAPADSPRRTARI